MLSPDKLTRLRRLACTKKKRYCFLDSKHPDQTVDSPADLGICRLPNRQKQVLVAFCYLFKVLALDKCITCLNRQFIYTGSRIYPLNSLRSQGSFLENAPLYKC